MGNIGMITLPIMIGGLILLFVLIWLIMRCIKGKGARRARRADAQRADVDVPPRVRARRTPTSGRP